LPHKRPSALLSRGGSHSKKYQSKAGVRPETRKPKEGGSKVALRKVESDEGLRYPLQSVATTNGRPGSKRAAKKRGKQEIFGYSMLEKKSQVVPISLMWWLSPGREAWIGPAEDRV